MTEFFTYVAKTHGPWIALVVFFVWNSRKDYQGVTKRLNQVEDWMKEKFLDRLEANSQALERNTEAMNKCQKRRES